ncbi:MAG: hypothetical protein ABSF32_09850 [Ignavibacteria bacterium]
MILRKFIPYIIFFVTVVQPCASYTQQRPEMSKEEWNIRRDDYAVQIIVLLRKLEGIDHKIDSLTSVDSLKSKELEKNEEELYALVGFTKSGIEEFRKKFELTEDKISSRISSPEDAKAMYFDEISRSKAICLPEFSERYSSMKKHLEEWEGFVPLIAETNKEVIVNKEETPVQEKINEPIEEYQNTPGEEKNIESSPVNERTYTVVKGDCLRSIAQAKYNSSELWPLIWLANKDGIVNERNFYFDFQRAVIDPNRIYPGQILFLPVVTQKMRTDVENFEKRIRGKISPEEK